MWLLLGVAVLGVALWIGVRLLRDSPREREQASLARLGSLNLCEKTSLVYFALGEPGKDRVKTPNFDAVPNWIFEDSDVMILDVDNSTIWPKPWDGDDLIRGERIVLAYFKGWSPMVASFAFPLRAHFPYTDAHAKTLVQLAGRTDSSSTTLIVPSGSWQGEIESRFLQAVDVESKRPVEAAEARRKAFQEIDAGLRHSRHLR